MDILVGSCFVLSPIILLGFCLYREFPYNTIRIPIPLLTAISIFAVLLISSPLLCLIFIFMPSEIWNKLNAHILSQLLVTAWYVKLGVIIIFLLVCGWNYKISSTLFRYLRNAWAKNRKLRLRYPTRSDLLYQKTADLVERFILHPVAVMAAYVEKKEEAMVDVKTTDGFLYSGKLGQYFINGPELVGISQNVSLKFDLRDGDRRPFYVIPNRGEIYFPSDKIQNLHFWRLKKGMPCTVTIKDEASAARLAWYCSLQSALPHMKLKITCYVSSDVKLREAILDQLERAGIDSSKPAINFVKI